MYEDDVYRSTILQNKNMLEHVFLRCIANRCSLKVVENSFSFNANKTFLLIQFLLKKK